LYLESENRKEFFCPVKRKYRTAGEKNKKRNCTSECKAKTNRKS